MRYCERKCDDVIKEIFHFCRQINLLGEKQSLAQGKEEEQEEEEEEEEGAPEVRPPFILPSSGKILPSLAQWRRC